MHSGDILRYSAVVFALPAWPAVKLYSVVNDSSLVWITHRQHTSAHPGMTVKNVLMYSSVYLLCIGILTPTDEFQYWADLAVSAKGEDRDRARFFSDAFQRQIAPQFASLSSLSMADVTELVEETHDVLDELWKQTDFDKPFPEARMKRLLEVIGKRLHNWLTLLGDSNCCSYMCTIFGNYLCQLSNWLLCFNAFYNSAIKRLTFYMPYFCQVQQCFKKFTLIIWSTACPAGYVFSCY